MLDDAKTVTRQMQIIAALDDFKLMMIVTLATLPLLIVFKYPSAGVGSLCCG